MNLLECYILEVHSVIDVTNKIRRIAHDTKYLEVDITYNCYGSLSRAKRIFTQDEWDYILERGYFIG